MIDLVTGATGFVGGHLAERLVREGARVRVLCRMDSERKLPPEVARSAEVARGDLRDRASLEAAVAGVRRVFHCAGRVSDWGPVEQFITTNVHGTEALYRAALDAKVERVVHMSSIAAFGTPSPPHLDDASPIAERSGDGYSRSKALGELVARRAFEAGLPIAILRPSVVYGWRSTWLEKPMEMAQRGTMFLLGGGQGTCHPCYIANLVDAMLLVSEHPRAVGEAFLVGDGESVSFREYFDAVASIAGCGPITRSIPLAVARTMASTLEAAARLRRSTARPLLTHTAIDLVATVSAISERKIREVLGYRPRYVFTEAIGELRREYEQECRARELKRRAS